MSNQYINRLVAPRYNVSMTREEMETVAGIVNTSEAIDHEFENSQDDLLHHFVRRLKDMSKKADLSEMKLQGSTEKSQGCEPDLIKVEIFEVSMDMKNRETFIIKSEIIDMECNVPSTGKKYVMMTFEDYEKLSGSKLKIESKPKKRKKK